jgi:hypothetical protein
VVGLYPDGTTTGADPLTTTAAPPLVAPSRTQTTSSLGALAVAGFASLGAGAVHAAAVGAHSEHRQAVWMFTVVAMFQLAWGAVALVRSGRFVALIGAVGNLALIAGWVLAKNRGISFVDGLEIAEPVQTADGLAAGLAIASVLGVVMAALRGRRLLAPSRLLTGSFGVAIAAVSIGGMVSAGSHQHAHGAIGSAHVHPGVVADNQPPAVVPPHAYDPTKPIDLSGVDGVTPEQQARAENLIAITLNRLPKFSDPATAVAAGFHSIGDAGTGFEHYVNWSYINDDAVLDPDRPESIVYRAVGEQRTLVSAMFMLPEGSTLETVPDVGGRLTQWHIHDNLCFTTDAVSPQVVGLTDAAGSCPSPLKRFTPVPMIHVWITKNPCGPFASLEGVGAGQIKPGEARLCDHVHGG